MLLRADFHYEALLAKHHSYLPPVLVGGIQVPKVTGFMASCLSKPGTGESKKDKLEAAVSNLVPTKSSSLSLCQYNDG